MFIVIKVETSAEYDTIHYCGAWEKAEQARLYVDNEYVTTRNDYLKKNPHDSLWCDEDLNYEYGVAELTVEGMPTGWHWYLFDTDKSQTFDITR